ncbi:MAG: SufD family Fe-S cluster assembly protein [Candidatus Kerfeldbacteria bacterium]|nr:SufD family Fe-S cluster assembly protein [Candidatus Kerfeldbacteria bacterium]
MARHTVQVPAGTTQFYRLPDDVTGEVELLVGRDAALTCFMPFWKGSRSLRIVARLQDRGASARLYGVFLGRNGDRVALSMETIHEAPATTGLTLLRSVLDDESVFDFDGMIRILPDAQQSDDILREHALLLSPRAVANAVPALEIQADDVRAAHAATAGRLDDEQVFYLQSRGVSERQAAHLIVQGFLDTVVRELDDRTLATEVGQRVDQLFQRT